MNTNNPTIAITHGDTNGIGYELILKSFADNSLLELFTPIVYGSPKVAAYHRKAIDVPANFTIITEAEEARHNRFNLLTTFAEEVRVELGTPTPEAGNAAFRAMRTAVDDIKNQKVDALVLAPADNATMQGPDYQFGSEKSYVEMMLDNKDKGLLLHVVDTVRIASLADHKALREVPAAVSAAHLEEKLRLLHTTLRRDYGIDDPRIAVMALNDVDRNGRFYGDEEQDIMVPTQQKLAEEGMKVYGPCSFNELLSAYGDGAYDAVLAMHDGQAAMLMQQLTDHVGYEYIAGLPAVVTLVAAGADYAKAGSNTANTALLRQAIYACIDICRQREAYDEAHANPLPKLYHERRDEGEKVRFAVSNNRKRYPQNDHERVADEAPDTETLPTVPADMSEANDNDTPSNDTPPANE